MLELEATFEDGKLTPIGDIEFPKGKQRVIVNFIQETEDDHELSDEWKEEIERRIKAIDEDKSQMLNYDDVMTRLNARFVK